MWPSLAIAKYLGTSKSCQTSGYASTARLEPVLLPSWRTKNCITFIEDLSEDGVHFNARGRSWVRQKFGSCVEYAAQ
ncbi:hypothetical protein E2C01_001924 [Portunus trituberculatus]|uniref:Uncharacterized protein n=1 Tax=Portunus trituberculatus TaxID=210409 RepID=A0A5B7CLN2_PORTR|nr:hypothetical protein [Portunus trituberculatus]